MRNAFCPKAYTSLLAFFTLAFFTASCIRQSTDLQTVTQVNPYVYGYTSGVVSKVSPIRVQFAANAISEGDVGKPASEKLLQISPAVAGTLIWEDMRTLRFEPTEPLPPATTFKVEIDVRKAIQDAGGTYASFNFEFRTRDQFAQTSLEGLYYPNERNYGNVQLRGTLYTSDVTQPEDLVAVLEAQQDGKKLKVSWEHSTDLMSHHFQINGVTRKKESSSVNLNWNSQVLGTKTLPEETVSIPAIDAFVLLDATVVQGEEQYILCQFSDPLQADQILDGLIDLSDYEGNIRYLIESNRVRVYPEFNLTGKFRLSAREGLRNSKNAPLQRESIMDIEFESVHPQVRLSGNGVIMPNSNGLHFPFEAVGLEAIDVEIFKIYHNNILQFLQDNQLDGNYDLFKVGQIVRQQKIDLKALQPGAKASKWNSYALDLSKLIQKDDQAIYSIRIGFRPEYAALSCMSAYKQGRASNSVSTPPSDLENADEAPTSILDQWYGAEGWTESYNWDNRENPCFSEYYNSERFVQRNVLASNLGIIAKAGGNQELLAVVTDLRTTDPLAKVELEIYNYQQQLIGKGNSDQDGIARITYKGKPFVLLAKLNKERGYLRLEDGEALEISRYDVDGAAVQKGLKGFIYADRGVWRPGDTVFANFVLDDRAKQLPENYPISMEVFNARGQLHTQRTTSKNVGGIYPMPFITKPDAPTGNWQMRIKAGGAVFEKIIKIESVKPNRLEVDLNFGGKTLYAASGKSSGTIQATWLHGAPASGMKATVEGQLKANTTGFNRFPSFSFYDPARKFESLDPIVLFDGKLDATGKATVSTEQLANQEAPGMLNIVFRSRVFEPGGDFSTDNMSVPYSPYNSYAGIEIPKNTYNEPRIDLGKSAPIRFALVSPDGKPLESRDLSVGVYTVEWRWWWDQFYENVSTYNTSTHYNAISRTNIRTNAEGLASLNFKPKQWGRYLIRVCDEATGHCAGDYIYVGNPWYGDDNDENYRNVAAMLSFKTDKEKYQVGETVKLTIPGGKAGKILVSLENGSRVLQTFWAPSKAGENTVSFKLTPEMSPNVYANITLIQPHGQVENDLPIRLYGIAPILVENPATRLQPEIKMPTVLKPEQTFQVEVREKTGKDMAYTLAVVDEGLLGLTRFKTPNPHEVFYAREALGVHSWDIYNKVLGAYSGTLDNVVAIGGDEGLDPTALNNTANRFEPVVRNLGPFFLKKGSTAKHQIGMPNYVGAVRVMVVAVADGAYGQAEQRAQVRNPLMVLATAPRVLSPGDAFQLPVNVFSNEPKIRQVQVSIKDKSGKTVLEGAANTTLQFTKTGNQLAFFPIKVKNTKGIARFEITATANGEVARQEIEIEVRNPSPYSTAILSEVLEPGQSWNPELTPIGIAGTRSGVLEVSGILPINLGERLSYLLQYPYGCLEQTVSAGFPQLFSGKLMNLTPEAQQQADDNIKATIERIKEFQTSEGGFSYWPGQNAPDAWTTSYAGHFLLEAKSMGYVIPQNILSDWLKFQKKAARIWDPKMPAFGYGTDDSHQLEQAYRLYTLARAGQPDLASMNRVRESKGLKPAARWRLAAAYASAGKTDVAKQLIQNQATDVAPYVELGFTYGSDLRDRALMLETLLLIKDSKRAALVARYISEELTSSKWWSTQSTAQALVAMARYAGENKLSDGFAFTYQLPGAKTIQAGAKTSLMQIQLKDAALQSGKALLKNTGKARIYVRFIYRGQPEPGAEQAASNDLNIQVAFKNMDGSTLAPEKLQQGKDFLAEVKITHPGTRPIPYQGLALSQIFPSGWEIINTRMSDFGGGTQSSFDYQDFRDDRVNTFFTLTENQTKVFRVQLNAAYPGRYYLPGTACAAMYDQSVGALAKGTWVQVVK